MKDQLVSGKPTLTVFCYTLARLFITFVLLTGIVMAEEVEVIDIDTGEVSLVPSEDIGPGMVLVNYQGKIYWADVRQLRKNEYQHEPFQGKLRARIEAIMDNLAEVYPLPYEEWEDGFRRDHNPENEMLVWEYIAAVYLLFSEQAADLSIKKEIYSVVLTCSFSSPEQVLQQVKLKHLSRETATEIVNFYFRKG